MAPTLRMMHSKQLQLEFAFRDGDSFGAAVAVAYSALASGHSSDLEPECVTVTGGSSRPDYQSTTRSRTLLLFVEDLRLWIGPLFSDNASSCSRCWNAALDRMSGSAGLSEVRTSYYRSNPEQFPAGLLNSFAQLAAAELMTLDEASISSLEGGNAYGLDLLSLAEVRLRWSCTCERRKEPGRLPEHLVELKHQAQVPSDLPLDPAFVLIPTERGVLVDGGDRPEILIGMLAADLKAVLTSPSGFQGIKNKTPEVPVSRERDWHIMRRDLQRWGYSFTADPRQVEMSTGERDTLAYVARAGRGQGLQAGLSVLRNTEWLLLHAEELHDVAEFTREMLRANGFNNVKRATVSTTITTLSRRAALRLVYIGGVSTSEVNVSQTEVEFLHSYIDWRSGIMQVVDRHEPNSRRGNGGTLRVTSVEAVTKLQAFRWAAILASELTKHVSGIKRIPASFSNGSALVLRSLLDAVDSTRSVVSPTSGFTTAFAYEELLQARTVRRLVPCSIPHFLEVPERLMLSSVRIADKMGPRESHLAAPFWKYLLSPHVSYRTHYCLDLSIVLTLLAFTFGDKDVNPNRKRWIPSAGNKGSTTAFLIVRRVEGVAPGVYMFDSRSNELVRCVSPQPPEAYDSGLPAAAALLVLVGSIGRLTAKYDILALKLACLDCGVACGQLKLLSASVGCRLDEIPIWSVENVERVLRLRKRGEIPLMMFTVGGKAQHFIKTAKSHQRVCLNEHTGTDDFVLKVFATAVDDLRLQQETSHIDMSLPLLLRLKLYLAYSRLCKQVSPTLKQVLDARMSTRTFLSKSVSREMLDTIIATVFGCGFFLSHELCVEMIVLNVTGLTPGAYRIDPQTLRYVLRETVSTSEVLRLLFIGDPCLDAAFAFRIFGVGISTGEMNIQYKEQLLAAGVCGQRLCIAATGLGLGSYLVAGMTGHSLGGSCRHGHAALLGALIGRSESMENRSCS